MNLPADAQPRQRPTRIVIVDSQLFFIWGIDGYLQAHPHIKITGHATNAADALQLMNDVHPDLVLIDSCLPGKSGIELAAEVHRLYPWIKVIVYSAHVVDQHIVDATEAGVKGYLLKTDGPEILLKAIETVIGGEQYLTDAIGGRVLTLMQRTATIPTKSQKGIVHTQFEIAVMREVCKGLISKVIAGRLHVEERLVTSTKERLFKQLNIGNTVELAMYAVRKYFYDPWE